MPSSDRYSEIRSSFRWEVPARYNIAAACCGKWAANRSRFALARLAPYEYPRTIEFIDSLPITTPGKVQRGELRQREQPRLSMAKSEN